MYSTFLIVCFCFVLTYYTRCSHGDIAGEIVLRLVDPEEKNKPSQIPLFAFDCSARFCPPRDSASKELMCDFPAEYRWNDEIIMTTDQEMRKRVKAFPEGDTIQYQSSFGATFQSDKPTETTMLGNQPLIRLLNAELYQSANTLLGLACTEQAESVNVSLFISEIPLQRKQTLPNVAYFTVGAMLLIYCNATMVLNERMKSSIIDPQIKWIYPTAVENRVKLSQITEYPHRNAAGKFQLLISAKLTVNKLQIYDSGYYACFVEEKNNTGNRTASIIRSKQFEIRVVESEDNVFFRQILPEGVVHVTEGANFTFKVYYQTTFGRPVLSKYRSNIPPILFLNMPPESHKRMSKVNPTRKSFSSYSKRTSHCESLLFNYNATILNCVVTHENYDFEYESGGTLEIFDMLSPENASSQITMGLIPRNLLMNIWIENRDHQSDLNRRLQGANISNAVNALPSLDEVPVRLVPSTDNYSYLQIASCSCEYYRVRCILARPASNNTTSIRLERKLLSPDDYCPHAHFSNSSPFSYALKHLSCIESENNHSEWEILVDSEKNIGNFSDGYYGVDPKFITFAYHDISPPSQPLQMLYRCISSIKKKDATESLKDSFIISFTDVVDHWNVGVDIVEWNNETRQPLRSFNERRQGIMYRLAALAKQHNHYHLTIRYYESDRLTLACRVPKSRLYLFEDIKYPVTWYREMPMDKQLQGVKPAIIPVTEAFGPLSPTIVRYDYGLLSTVLMQFSNLSLVHHGYYWCDGAYLFSTDAGAGERRKVFIDVVRPVKPYFESERDYPAPVLNIPFGKQFNQRCSPRGLPKPRVRWLKNGKPFGDDNYLTFTIEENVGGIYSCVAESKFGRIVKNTVVNVLDAPVHQGKFVSIIIGTLVASAIIVCTLIGCSLLRSSIQKRELQALKNEWQASASYDSTFEIAKERFEINVENKLGEGCFGIVYQGALFKSKTANTSKMIAVKVPKDGKNPFHQSMLLDEMKIMMAIGAHVNILKLIGACTSNMVKGELFILMELCSLDSMETFLRKERLPTNIAVSVVHEATPLIKEKGYRGEIKTEKSPETVLLNRLILINTENENALNNTNRDITFVQISFALQTANGMDYLGSKLLIHRDLATRNLLLMSQNNVVIVKIADYGFARQQQTYHMRGSDDNQPKILPVAWMAPESLNQGNYITQSDIWSFGVVLWEIFTLGDNPENDYANRLIHGTHESFVQRLSDFLQRDGRLSKPSPCSDTIFQLMMECWAMNPEQRPSFSTSRNRIFAEMEMECDFEKREQLIEVLGIVM